MPRTVGLVVALVLVASATGCAGSAETPDARCDLSAAAVSPVPPPSDATPGREPGPALAVVSTSGGMNESGKVTRLTVEVDGSVAALATGAGEAGLRYARLAPADLTRLQRCIDESGFLDIEEGFRSGTQGRMGDRFCTVTDASDATVVARGSSGLVRTATGYALGLGDIGCDLGYPRGLAEVHGALEQVRQRVAG